MSDGLWLFLDRRGLKVSVEHQTLRIDEPDGSFRRIPPALLETVVVQGRVLVASDAWRLLAEKHVPAVLLPGRGHGPVAWMGSGLSGSVGMRRAQFALSEDAKAHLQLATRMVHRKFASYRDVLAWAGHPKAPFLYRLEALEERLSTAVDADAVRGVEGVAARLWYEWMAERIPVEWGFSGRNRRPPRDPVNALLSLGYTLLTTQARGRVEAAGLDAHLGYLHEPVPGRPALALDLVEALRPWVDMFVLSLLDRVVTPVDFCINKADGCRLDKNGRGRFYAAWSSWNREIPPASGTVGKESHGQSGMGRAFLREIRDLRYWLGLRYQREM